MEHQVDTNTKSYVLFKQGRNFPQPVTEHIRHNNWGGLFGESTIEWMVKLSVISNITVDSDLPVTNYYDYQHIVKLGTSSIQGSDFDPTCAR